MDTFQQYTWKHSNANLFYNYENNNDINNWKYVYVPECIKETLFDNNKRGKENEESINHSMKRKHIP